MCVCVHIHIYIDISNTHPYMAYQSCSGFVVVIMLCDCVDCLAPRPCRCTAATKVMVPMHLSVSGQTICVVEHMPVGFIGFPLNYS